MPWAPGATGLPSISVGCSVSARRGQGSQAIKVAPAGRCLGSEGLQPVERIYVACGGDREPTLDELGDLSPRHGLPAVPEAYGRARRNGCGEGILERWGLRGVPVGH